MWESIEEGDELLAIFIQQLLERDIIKLIVQNIDKNNTPRVIWITLDFLKGIHVFMINYFSCLLKNEYK